MDTSVWSLVLTRDSAAERSEVSRLREALGGGETVCPTGLVLQELLQGLRGPRDRPRIVDCFADAAMIVPTRDDRIDASRLRNGCRRQGIQVGTIDALHAQLCIRHDLVTLTIDRDFSYIEDQTSLRLWPVP